MDSTGPVVELIHTDGTAEYQFQKYRFSSTNNNGNPEGLLSELVSNAMPFSWISRASRDTALETIKRLPLDNDVKASLVTHICNTGYLKDSTVERVKIFFAEESRGFAGDGIACWGIFGGSAPWLVSHLVRDYLNALKTEDRYQLCMPFESIETKDRIIQAIFDWPEDMYYEGEVELTELNKDMLASLRKVVTSAAYVS